MSFERNQDTVDKMISTNLDVNFEPRREISEINLVPKIAQQPLPDNSVTTNVESEDLPEIPTVKLPRKSCEWIDEINRLGTVERLSVSDESINEAEKSNKKILLELQEGIRASLDKLHTYSERDLLMTDFIFVEEHNFSKRSPVSDSNFTLHVYAPVAFRYFRELFGISTEDFKQSVCNSQLHSVSCDSRAGSVFYASSDDRFILKTVQQKEAKFLKELFPGYFLNLAQHTKSLLPKYFGLFSHISGVKTVRVLIMNNILPISYQFSEIYDLKGSTYSKRQNNKKTAPRSRCLVLKDLDFLNNWANGFYLPSKMYDLLLKNIERDCKVLESYDIMDYSLLLGVVLPDDSNSTDDKKTAERKELNKNLIGPFEARTMKGKTVYLFLGIIDILQSYTWKKKIECCFKSLFYRKDTISVNNPCFYAQRFQNFLANHVFKCIPTLVPASKKEHWDIRRSTTGS